MSVLVAFTYENKEFELAGDILLPLGNNGINSGLRNESFRWPLGIVYVDLDTTFSKYLFN